MTDYIFPREGAVNAEKLDGELKAQLAAVSGISVRSGTVTVVASVLSANEQITAGNIITAHDPALTPAQQTDADLVNAGITARDARDALRRALYNGTAAGTVYTAMKGFIDGNPKLLQLFAQDVALHNAVFGWTVSTGSNATAAAQRQYIVIARQTLALL